MSFNQAAHMSAVPAGGYRNPNRSLHVRFGEPVTGILAEVDYLRLNAVTYEDLVESTRHDGRNLSVTARSISDLVFLDSEMAAQVEETRTQMANLNPDEDGYDFWVDTPIRLCDLRVC